MLIARVIGELVATQKHASHEGRKLLLVQPLNLDGTERGDAVVALDAVDAGVGDKVLLATEGFSAMPAVGRPNSPIDMAVIGFIDHIELMPGVSITGRHVHASRRPDFHSTRLFTTRVATATRVRSDATPKAAENWYSL